jgi:hypothetical protein
VPDAQSDQVLEKPERILLRWLAQHRSGMSKDISLQGLPSDGPWKWLKAVSGEISSARRLKKLLGLIQQCPRQSGNDCVVGFWRALAAWEAAWLQLTTDDAGAALELVQFLGVDGLLIEALVTTKSGSPSLIVARSKYRAYQARRAASRCEALGYAAEAERWCEEAVHWDRLAFGECI